MDIIEFIKKNKYIVIAICIIIFLLVLNNCYDKKEHMVECTDPNDPNCNTEVISGNLDIGAISDTNITDNVVDNVANVEKIKNKIPNKQVCNGKFDPFSSIKHKLVNSDAWDTHQTIMEDTYTPLKDIDHHNKKLFEPINILSKDKFGKTLFANSKLDKDGKSIPHTIERDEDNNIVFNEPSGHAMTKKGYLMSKVFDVDLDKEVTVYLTRLNLTDCGMDTDTNIKNEDCVGGIPLLLPEKLLLRLPSRDEISNFRFTRLQGDEPKFMLTGEGIGKGTLTLKNKLKNDSMNVLCFQNIRSLCNTTKQPNLEYCEMQNDIEIEHTLFGFRLKFTKTYYEQDHLGVYLKDENENLIFKNTKVFYASACKTNGAECRINSTKQYRLCLNTEPKNALVFNLVKFNKKNYGQCISACNNIFTNSHKQYKKQVIRKLIPIINEEFNLSGTIASKFFALPKIEKLKYLDRMKSTIETLSNENIQKAVDTKLQLSEDQGAIVQSIAEEVAEEVAEEANHIVEVSQNTSEEAVDFSSFGRTKSNVEGDLVL